VASGTAITIPVGGTFPGIDFTLSPLAAIAGTVTAAADAAPIGGAHVAIFDAAGALVKTVTTQATGAYAATGLPSGVYFARVTGSAGYDEMVFDALSCAPACDVTLGTPVAAAVGSVVTASFVLPDNTQSGSVVLVRPRDAASDTTPVALTFARVAEAGRTTIAVSANGPSLPEGYKAPGPAMYVAAATTATGDAAIAICVSYDGHTFVSPVRVRLLKNAAGGWTDVTSSRDGGAGAVCGTADSLGTFALAEVVPSKPHLTWPGPAGIVYGTALGATELNATADAPGTFTYTPPAGTLMAAGAGQLLAVEFTPSDALHYETASLTATIDVARATPALTWPAPAAIVFGAALGTRELNATADVPGTFVYAPPPGTVLPVGDHQQLSTTFTPADSANYRVATAATQISVLPSDPLAVAVVTPNGGESVLAGVPTIIRWAATGGAPGPQSFDVSVSVDGYHFTPIAGCWGLPGTARSCVWNSPGPAAMAARIRVTAHDSRQNVAVTTSAAPFCILTPVITVTSPNGAGSWLIGSTRLISFTHNLGSGMALHLDVSRDGGTTWSQIEAMTTTSPVSGSYVWTVTGPASPRARVRVSVASAPQVNDASDVDFSITGPQVTVTSPNGNGSVRIGTTQCVAFTHNLGIDQLMQVDLSRDGGATWEPLATTITVSAASGSSCSVVTGPPTSRARVRVSLVADPSVQDVSDLDYSIARPAITVTSPNGAGSIRIGSTLNILFTHNLGTGQPVTLEISHDGGASWSVLTTLTTTAAASGAYAWTVTGPPAVAARVRASWASDPTVNDISDVDFALAGPTVTVTSPNGNGTIAIGSTRAITFTHNLGAGELVNLEVSRDGGASWSLLAQVTTAATGSGTYSWFVTGPPTSQARIRARWAADSSVCDISDLDFSIR
jgi:hypothetical protein